MTIEVLFAQLLRYRQGVFIAIATIPVVIFAVSFVHGVYDGREAPWRHLYAFVVHVMTAILAVVGALFVYHILEVGSSGIDRDMVFLGGAFLLGWLAVLAVVKRAVDFSMIRSVRNPFGLLFCWIIGWAGAGALDFYGLLIIPGPRPIILAAVALVVFFLLRFVLRLFSGTRS